MFSVLRRASTCSMNARGSLLKSFCVVEFFKSLIHLQEDGERNKLNTETHIEVTNGEGCEGNIDRDISAKHP